jgi:MFS family permease
LIDGTVHGCFFISGDFLSMNELSDQRVTTPRASLWKNRDFLRLWAGQTISELGTRITRDGIPLLAVITLGATPVQMGFLSASASAPVLLFSLFAGLWVDRLRRKPVMILSDLGRALLLASIPLAAAFHLLQIEQLYLVIALVGVLTVFFDVAYQAYLPSLVTRAYILEGNSKLAVSSSIAELAGPGLAGFLIQVLTAPVAILLDSLSFLVSVLSLAVIRKPEPAPQPVQTRGRWVSDIREGLHTIWSNPVSTSRKFQSMIDPTITINSRMMLVTR